MLACIKLNMILIILSILFIAAFVFHQLYYNRRNLPPGPLPVPLVGNFLQICARGERAFLQWHHKYGPVYTIWLGTIPVVCVTDYQKMVEIFVKNGDAYAGRISSKSAFGDKLEALRGRDLCGLIAASGDKWREQRRFTLHMLRDFGLGKNLMQNRIFDELGLMFQKLDAKICETPEVNLPELIDVAVGCIINDVIFGDRMDEGDKEAEFWEIKRLTRENQQQVTDVKTLLYMMYPNLLSHVPTFSTIGEQILARTDRFYAFFESRVNRHHAEMEQSGQWEATAHNFVDAFLKEMQKRQREERADAKYFDIGQCANVCADLWSAGQESTAATIIWAIAFLLNNPECLNRLYEELDTVIGSNRLITLADRSSLPYTSAVINESQRKANLLPVNLMRATMQPVNLDGYKLPEGTAIIPQISVLFINEKHFPNANMFKPERFLDENEKLKQCEELIPFSIGKRECPGRSLATMELFLFVANLFNQYKISPGKVPPSLIRKRGMIIHCAPYTCLVEKRYSKNNSK